MSIGKKQKLKRLPKKPTNKRSKRVLQKKLATTELQTPKTDPKATKQLHSMTKPAYKPVKLIPLDQLLLHKSDTMVRPIIGNRDIERPTEVKFSAKLLGFECRTPQEIVAGIESHEIESHFADIYNYLSKQNLMGIALTLIASESTNVNEKLNALSYFETIIKCSSVANRLVNSAFMNLLL